MDSVLFKMKDDPRITKVGKLPAPLLGRRAAAAVQRAARRDEPRGPRPPLPSEVATTTTTRTGGCSSGRGITGLWQVSGRSDLAWDEAVRLDLYYVDNWSMTSDLVILFKTVKAVLGRAGAY